MVKLISALVSLPAVLAIKTKSQLVPNKNLSIETSAFAQIKSQSLVKSKKDDETVQKIVQAAAFNYNGIDFDDTQIKENENIKKILKAERNTFNNLRQFDPKKDTAESVCSDGFLKTNVSELGWREIKGAVVLPGRLLASIKDENREAFVHFKLDQYIEMYGDNFKANKFFNANMEALTAKKVESHSEIEKDEVKKLFKMVELKEKIEELLAENETSLIASFVESMMKHSLCDKNKLATFFNSYDQK